MEFKMSQTIVFGILSIVIVVIVFFLSYYRRKYKLALHKAQYDFKKEKEQLKEEAYFGEQIIQAQVEIREQILKNISWELHDNIGQLMTLAKIQVQNAKNDPEKLEQVAKTIGSGLTELRMLSKITNPSLLKKLSLEEVIQLELERYNRLNIVASTYKSTGEQYHLNVEERVVLFRIVQEFFVNTVQHSEATTLEVCVNYSSHRLEISAKDNGRGFNKALLNNSNYLGLKTMKDRADLIGATLHITPILGEGTHLHIIYHLINQTHEI